MGELQDAIAAASSLHRKVEASLAVNPKLGDLSLLRALGLPVIEAVGATVSIVHVEVAVPVSAAGLDALTSKVCDPPPRPV